MGLLRVASTQQESMMGTLPTSLGQAVLSLRRRRALSQRQVARQATISKPMVQAIEHDRRRPSRPVIDRLATALAADQIERDLLFISAGYAPSPATVRTLLADLAARRSGRRTAADQAQENAQLRARVGELEEMIGVMEQAHHQRR